MLIKLITNTIAGSVRVSSANRLLGSIILKRQLHKYVEKWPVWHRLTVTSRVPLTGALSSARCGYRAGRTEVSAIARSLQHDADVDQDASETETGESNYGLRTPHSSENRHEKWKVASDIVDESAGNFRHFRISEATQSKLRAQGIPFLFPVQISTFNPIFDGQDVIVQARTGCGKTMSYGLPLVEHLHQTVMQQQKRFPQLLVMTPTRELARQVADVMSSLTDTLSVVSVYGGAPISSQESKIRAGVDIVVGTPGRIADFLERGTLDLSQLRHVVLDEVDRMLDMGFADSVDNILQHRYTRGSSEKNPQTLLFSATIPSWVQRIARKYLRADIVKLDLVGQGSVRTATSVEHLAMACSNRDRTTIIANTLQAYSGAHGRAIIFCERKKDADMLATSSAIRVETHVLHGDIPQDKREMVLKGFRDGRYRCLIATDVAARGLDIPEVDLVIQCSPPKDVDSYIHRSGRTGRAGRSGVSVLLYKPAELHDLMFVEKTAGIKFKRIRAPSIDSLSAAAGEDAVKSIEQVSDVVAERFLKLAENLASSRGPVQALASAIAVISGYDRPMSLLTSMHGFTTYLLNTEDRIDRPGQAWRALEESVPAEIKEKATGLRLCANHTGCVFDLPSECDELLADNSALTRITELPDLEEPPVVNEFSSGPRYHHSDSFNHMGRSNTGRDKYSSAGWRPSVGSSRRNVMPGSLKHNSSYRKERTFNRYGGLDEGLDEE